MLPPPPKAASLPPPMGAVLAPPPLQTQHTAPTRADSPTPTVAGGRGFPSDPAPSRSSRAHSSPALAPSRPTHRCSPAPPTSHAPFSLYSRLPAVPSPNGDVTQFKPTHWLSPHAAPSHWSPRCYTCGLPQRREGNAPLSSDWPRGATRGAVIGCGGGEPRLEAIT